MKDSQAPLTGRTVLITGAAKRLGGAVALALAEQGADIVIHYHRSKREATALSEQIRQTGAAAWLVQGDLMDQKQMERLFEQAHAQAGAINILINNASIFDKDTLWQTTEDSLWRNLQVHAMAPLILARALAKQTDTGHVINFLDTRVVCYDQEHASYHLSKRILLTLTRMLAMELAPNIAVNAIAPGLILPPAGKDERYLQELAHTNPLKRHGSPKDVVDAVLFLLRSRFITGQIIYVDGGFHMKGRMYE
jgi:NAD(P)-dependent dehydrogenase (short-subunit alcohol dehydrogenase family)